MRLHIKVYVQSCKRMLNGCKRLPQAFKRIPENAAYVIDGMATGATTFGELAAPLLRSYPRASATAFTSFSTSTLRCQSNMVSDQGEAHQVC